MMQDTDGYGLPIAELVWAENTKMQTGLWQKEYWWQLFQSVL